ncbi:MAG: hypothetical protein EOP48_00355 [Sphingobacteriales bacterium]|nr:MAG: hypothetical protein EOP48_00355 [Sphingobacteriales bacterium]
MKISGGALYFAIVIALIIAIICSSLISFAHYNRLVQLKYERQQRLRTNAFSGILIALNQGIEQTEKIEKIDLYNDGMDSICIIRKSWGIYRMALLQSHIKKDTLKKAFLLGQDTREDKDAVYLADEDRPLNISGEARIIGNTRLPKSGIRQSYVEGRSYTGRQLVLGEIKNSERLLSPLSQIHIASIEAFFSQNAQHETTEMPKKIQRSFWQEPLRIWIKPETNLSGSILEGNVILFSDTTVNVPADAQLKNLQIYAKEIRIANGFKGNLQLFARDSIVLADKVHLNYPSSLVVLSDTVTGANVQQRIVIGKDSSVKGVIIGYQSKRTPLQILVTLGNNTIVEGEIYVSGALQLSKGVKVLGKVSCYKFFTKTQQSNYENYLVDATLDREGRSPFYLSPGILHNIPKKQKVLKWLN